MSLLGEHPGGSYTRPHLGRARASGRALTAAAPGRLLRSDRSTQDADEQLASRRPTTAAGLAVVVELESRGRGRRCAGATP